MFHANKLPQVCLLVKTIIEALSDTLKVSLLFVSTYLCETGSSAVVDMKTKYLLFLTTENRLRVAISSVTQRFGKLRAESHTKSGM
jgi:hypothetical protein